MPDTADHLYVIPLIQLNKTGSFFPILGQEYSPKKLSDLFKVTKLECCGVRIQTQLWCALYMHRTGVFLPSLGATGMLLRLPQLPGCHRATLFSVKKRVRAQQPARCKDGMFMFLTATFHLSSSTPGTPRTMGTGLNSLRFSSTYDQYCLHLWSI